MRRFQIALPLTVAIVLCLATSIQAQQPEPAQVKSSLGVSLEVASGHAIAFPIQVAGAAEDKLPVIPMPGNKKISGIRIYPYMNGDQVAVRVAALLPAKPATSTPQVQRVGDYVIGRLGDSLKLTDLTKLGLRPLAVSVVNAPFLTEEAGDPCCVNNQGLICCGATLAKMCANCPDCCAGFRKQFAQSSHAGCVQQKQDAVVLKPKLEMKKPD
jgi:hypothetical protein